MAAHNALYCLTMAQAGVPGTREPLEGTYGYYAAYAEPGSDLSKIAFDPAGPSEVLNVAVKPYPSCRCSHAAIDGVSALVQQERLQPEEIESIAVMISPASYQLVGGEPEQKRRPATVVDAQFSGYFAAAVAACEPSYTWDSYGRLDDPRLQRIMDRTEVHRMETLAGLASEGDASGTGAKLDAASAVSQGRAGGAAYVGRGGGEVPIPGEPGAQHGGGGRGNGAGAGPRRAGEYHRADASATGARQRVVICRVWQEVVAAHPPTQFCLFPRGTPPGNPWQSGSASRHAPRVNTRDSPALGCAPRGRSVPPTGHAPA